MGRLTEDMTRLVGEIQTAHRQREGLVQDLKQGAQELRREVGRIQAGFRAAQREMARRQQQMLRGFVSHLQGTVGSLRKGFAADLAGAHRAWSGGAATAAPGRTRRGGKWFGSEMA